MSAAAAPRVCTTTNASKNGRSRVKYAGGPCLFWPTLPAILLVSRSSQLRTAVSRSSRGLGDTFFRMDVECRLESSVYHLSFKVFGAVDAEAQKRRAGALPDTRNSNHEWFRKAKRREEPASSSTRQMLKSPPWRATRGTTPQRSAGGPGPASGLPTAARSSPQPRALVRLEKRAVPRNPAPAASHW